MCLNVLPEIKISRVRRRHQSFLIENSPRLRRGMRCIRPIQSEAAGWQGYWQGCWQDTYRDVEQGCWRCTVVPCGWSADLSFRLSGNSRSHWFASSAFYLLRIPLFWEQKEKKKEYFNMRLATGRWISFVPLIGWMTESFPQRSRWIKHINKGGNCEAVGQSI